MARRVAASDDNALARLVAERLQHSSAPWLVSGQHQVARARLENRLAHGLLIHGIDGVGQSVLAMWTAQLILCDEQQDQPCDACASCMLFAAGNHPDFYLLQLEDDARFVKVDQVRELCATLALRSYRGRFKVGLIDPADRMNINANNALLKTLEEPSEDTVLLLAGSRIDRLPRTVVSRCQRVHVGRPPYDIAVAWLQAQLRRDDWPALIALAGGAPLKALADAEAGVGDLAAEMNIAVADIGTTFDPFASAAEWYKDRPAARLAWLEQWLERAIRAGYGVSDAVNNNRDNGLPRGSRPLNMRSAFALLDRVRDARVLLEGSLNTHLLFEDLLAGLSDAFAAGKGVRKEIQG